MRTKPPLHPLTGLALRILVAGFVLPGCGRQPLAPTSSAPSAHRIAAQETGDSHGAGARGASAAPGQAPDNLDPELQIVLPHPSPLLAAVVPPAFTVRWEASDPDARFSRPLAYRYLLLDEHSAFPIQLALSSPDSLRRRYGPLFEEWSQVRGGHMELELRDLTPNSNYLLVLVALDEDGGFNRVFSTRTNMLSFRAAVARSLGPLITITGDIQYQGRQGGILDDPALAPRFTIPAGRKTTIAWTARTPVLDEMDGTRWALDPLKFDDTSHGAGQDGGWSGWSATEATASIGPFSAPGEHRFYVEARTKVGWLTRLLLILEVPATGIARARTD